MSQFKFDVLGVDLLYNDWMDRYYLSAIVSVYRHGEKNEQGELTENGFRQAIERGLQLKHLQGQIHVAHSGVDRVKKTALGITRYIDKQFHEFTNQEPTLEDTSLDPETTQIDELHYMVDKTKYSAYFTKWNKTLPPEKASQRVQKYLEYKTKSPEPETTAPPYILAQRLSRVLISQLEQSIATSYDVRENFVNTTHEPVIMSFLYYALNNFKAGGKSFVKEIGGSVNFAEGFDIFVYQSKSNKTLIQLIFRDILVQISPVDLKNFVKN